MRHVSPLNRPLFAIAIAILSSVAATAEADPGRVDLAFEPAYKLGSPPAASMPMAERAAWNHGAMGPLSAPVPKDTVHPMPRVIIDVEGVEGPHRAADIQRLARRNGWIQAIRCYELGAYKNQNLRGRTTLSFTVGPSGEVTASETTGTTLADPFVATCFAERMQKLVFTKADGISTVKAALRIYPGDEPTPPSASLLVPGDGMLDGFLVQHAIERERPRFEACFRQALRYAPALWGRIAIRFHVTETGVTDEAYESESAFPDPRVSRCILHVARTIRFAPPTGGELRFLGALRLWTSHSALPGHGSPRPLVTSRPRTHR